MKQSPRYRKQQSTHVPPTQRLGFWVSSSSWLFWRSRSFSGGGWRRRCEKCCFRPRGARRCRKWPRTRSELAPTTRRICIHVFRRKNKTNRKERPGRAGAKCMRMCVCVSVFVSVCLCVCVSVSLCVVEGGEGPLWIVRSRACPFQERSRKTEGQSTGVVRRCHRYANRPPHS
jgi:hypothetical protein